jgi:hypothetical protein
VKDYTSKFLKTVAWAYLLFPISYLGMAALLFDVPLIGMAEILFSPVFYVNAAVGVLTGFGLREMRRWAWYLLLLSTALIAYENAMIVRSVAESHHKVAAYTASLVFLFGLIHRISREIRVPYFFPKIRWWESNPRYKLSVPARVKAPARAARQGEAPSPEMLHEGEIMDLSMGGCFVKLRSDLRLDDSVSITFKVFGLPVESKGTVVWRTPSTVTHPKGIGIKFSLDNKKQRRTLRQINNRLRKIASLYRRSRYLMNQDEFLKRLDELERVEDRDTA